MKASKREKTVSERAELNCTVAVRMNRLGWIIHLTILCLMPVLAGAGEASGFLDSWSLNDTNGWTSDLGYAPLSFTNLGVSNLGDGTNGNALVLDSTNAAWLQFHVIEADTVTNLSVGPDGSIMLWFAPNGSGTNEDGTGPGVYGRLLEAGWMTNGSPGFWSLYLDSAGCNIYFSAGDGVSQTAYLSAPIDWTTNRWHHLALTYSSDTNTATALYIDGALVTNGLPLSVWPSSGVLAAGFFVGSDSTGVAQAHGMLDDIATYNYVLDPEIISAVWQNLWVKMAHFSSRQASPLRVATGGDASWRLEARRRRSPACC